jgi:predicted nuclease of restriction endonuclease-like (RecB) superfamily
MTKKTALTKESEYLKWLENLKAEISRNRQRAALSVNEIAMQTYWKIGQDIIEKEKQFKWGSDFLNRLSRDLSDHFKDIKGFSRRNLYAIRQWYLFYSKHSEFVPQAVAQIPWGHNRLIVSKIKSVEKALWYAAATASNGWARDLLELKINKKEYERLGKSITNFNSTLQSPQSVLAQETLKDPYNFDFLGIGRYPILYRHR